MTRQRHDGQRGSWVGLLGAAWVVLAAAAPAADAAGPRVLPDGQTPDDQRLGDLKDLNGYFPFDPPETRDEWTTRSESLRRRVLVSMGLWPMPEKTPLRPVIHGRVERDGFSVEKVYFESCPGHFVTGLLFRPEGVTGRRPAILCPHGHGGRMQDHGAEGVRKHIAQGAERFEDSGRFPKLARCAQFARMGNVAFIFDMIGYADSVQIPREVAHGFRKQRPDMDSPDSWGFFSTQAEMRMQSILGLQTWNSIRALDFLCQLPDVDPARVGVTGGSGGGTQTILLGAIDPRPIVAFPQGMVSTAMQGGCTCENACCLRVGTGNVELAALFAPRPLGMTAAKDWTVDMMTKGYPQLQQLYGVLVKNNVLCKSLTHFPHNYNYVTRAIMYSWFNKHMKLGLPEPIVEEDWRPLTPDETTVWNDKHPRPEGGPEYERALTKYLDKESQRLLHNLIPTDADSLGEYRNVVGGAIDTLIGRGLPEAGAVEAEGSDFQPKDGYRQLLGLIRYDEHGETLPGVALLPAGNERVKHVVIWVSGRGKEGLFQDDGRPRSEVRRLLDAGVGVLGVNLLYQGEFLAAGESIKENRTVSNTREFAGYTFGYNHPLFASRVHDILTLVSLFHQSDNGPDRVDLVGVDGAGPWVAAARAQAGQAVHRAVVDTQGFRFRRLTSYRDVNFLPGSVKYGDLPGMLSLSAPHPLWLAGEKGDVPDIVAACYRAADAADHVSSFSGEGAGMAQAAVDWLLEDR